MLMPEVHELPLVMQRVERDDFAEAVESARTAFLRAVADFNAKKVPVSCRDRAEDAYSAAVNQAIRVRNGQA